MVGIRCLCWEKAERKGETFSFSQNLVNNKKHHLSKSNTSFWCFSCFLSLEKSCTILIKFINKFEDDYFLEILHCFALRLMLLRSWIIDWLMILLFLIRGNPINDPTFIRIVDSGLPQIRKKRVWFLYNLIESSAHDNHVYL